LIYADPTLRAGPNVLLRNRCGQSGLWRFGISGDLPIVLLSISDPAKTGMARQLIKAHAYWRMKALAADLVILNESASGAGQALDDEIARLIEAEGATETVDKPGGIFVRRADQISFEDRVLLQSAARIVLAAENAMSAEPVAIHESAARPVRGLTRTRTAIQDAPWRLTQR